MNKYVKLLVESFFDELEDDLDNSDTVINQVSHIAEKSLKLTDCKNEQDVILYFYNMFNDLITSNTNIQVKELNPVYTAITNNKIKLEVQFIYEPEDNSIYLALTCGELGERIKIYNENRNIVNSIETIIQTY